MFAFYMHSFVPRITHYATLALVAWKRAWVLKFPRIPKNDANICVRWGLLQKRKHTTYEDRDLKYPRRCLVITGHMFQYDQLHDHAYDRRSAASIAHV